MIWPEKKHESQVVQEERKEMFTKHGLGIMWIKQQREEFNIRLKGKKTKHTDGFVYVGGLVADNRHLEMGAVSNISNCE